MDLPADDFTRLSSRRLLLGSVLVGAGCGLVILLSSPGLPMVWDEGNAIRRAEGIARWTGRWTGRWTEQWRPGAERQSEPAPWSEEAIAEDWQYTTRLEGHPALPGILIALGRGLSAGRLEPLQSARLGPILLFSLAAGAMFYRMARQFSLAAALGATASLLTLPRLFAHVHFALLDGPVAGCWVLAWASFAPARANRRWAVLLGIALGMTLSSKATGWLAPVPFLVWAVLYRDRPAAKALALAAPVALLTFVALNPPLWHHPLAGTAEFMRLNLNRGDQAELNISTWFLGRMYNLDHPLPWYNTLLWTAVSVPVPILLLAGLGLFSIVRRPGRNRAGTLLVANWLVLLVVRALPGTPPHDGVRLLLPSFAFLATLAGVGCGWVLGRLAAVGPNLAAIRRVLTTGLIGLYLGSASSLYWYAPHWLSYYNLIIGGLPGATATGMEPTYYWDGLDRSVLAWLDRNTRPDENVRFAAGPRENLAMMRDWGLLRFGCHPEPPGRFRWYVVQNRPSAWRPADRWLFEHARPAFGKVIRSGGRGPWRLDVPLVAVYSHRQFVHACKVAESTEIDD